MDLNSFPTLVKFSICINLFLNYQHLYIDRGSKSIIGRKIYSMSKVEGWMSFNVSLALLILHMSSIHSKNINPSYHF